MNNAFEIRGYFLPSLLKNLIQVANSSPNDVGKQVWMTVYASKSYITGL